MSKSAGYVLLLFGLGIGLFLGFNPKAHQATMQEWDKATAAVAQVRVTSASKPGAPKPPIVNLKPVSVPSFSTSATWKQVSAAIDSLWSSVQSVWGRVTANISNAR